MELFESTGFLLNFAARLSKKNLSDRFADYKITNPQWAAIKLLSQRNSISQATIADEMNSDRATCGAVLDKLIKKGLIKKELNPSDSRSYVVTLQPEGFELVNKLTDLAVSSNEQALSGISEAEIELFNITLKKIIKNLEN